MVRFAAFLWLLLAVLPGGAGAVVVIDVGTARGDLGTVVSVEVVLNTDEDDVAATENVVAWLPPLRLLSCTRNPQTQRSGFFSLLPGNCDPLANCTSLKAIMLSFNPVPTIPDGTVLYRCDVAIEAGASEGSYPLSCSRPAAGTAEGKPIETRCDDGSVEVNAPAPTATPDPRATPVPCAGDCNGNGAVSIGELVTGVRIALGEASLEECSAADPGGDGLVTIADLIRAVGSALDGC
jgi:hypothetical protein